MGIESAFHDYVNWLQEINMEDKNKRMKRITKKMNKTYYDGNNSEEEHFLLIGSLGRHTAIKSVSDVDIAFILSQKEYDKYNSRKNNGQSDLLQDIKKTLSELASRTIVRGDGQVVVLEFSDYEVELCPFFKKNDDSYIYPNSNNGGKWQTSKPVAEIVESEVMIDETNGHFQNVCNMLRAWKNEQGFKFGGLLVDTLVYNFFLANKKYYATTFSEYPELLKDLFKYLKGLNKHQDFWLALGSNQRVYNKDGQFVIEAKKVYNKIKDIENDSDDMYGKMRELFGNEFPKVVEEQIGENSFKGYKSDDTEEFIGDEYKVDIRSTIEIKCEVSQDGWRDKTPLKLIRFLQSDKSLEFKVEVSDDIEEPYQIKWKVCIW